ncbi:MAG: hypothetical protein H0Z28_10070 [Archaeoglobus sp.]|nr:hypothetical protein [Archaeoglobus sp.]
MIRTISTSLACIFKYPESIDRRDLISFLKEKGYLLPKPKREELVTESGRSIGEIVEEPFLVAYKEEDEGIRIIYNNNANLPGLSQSSFVSVIGPEFESTFSNFEVILEYIRNKKLESDIRMYEATFTGLVEREDLKSNISEFFKLEKMSKLEELLNQAPRPAGFRVRGQNPTEANWFDLMIDTATTENPKLSLFRLIIRYDDYNKYNELSKLIENIIGGI